MSASGALVVGATGGLGGAVVRSLLSAGFEVTFTGRHPEGVERLQAGATGARGRVVDALDDRAIRAVVEDLDRGPGLAAYVHVAGGWAGGRRIDELTEADWVGMLDVNFTTLRRSAGAAFATMRRRRAGSIVTIGALAGLSAGAGMAPYAVAKAAVIALTRCLSEEGKDAGVRANCIIPGIIDTAANRAAMPDSSRDGWVPPERIARAIAFLCGPGGEGISGATLMMKGSL